MMHVHSHSSSTRPHARHDHDTHCTLYSPQHPDHIYQSSCAHSALSVRLVYKSWRGQLPNTWCHLLCCNKIAEAEAAVSVNKRKWLVMHMHVQLKLDELRGPQTLGSL